jgi:hypothetical protein
MALKPCRECGAQVSTAAETCPHCGVKRPVKSPASSVGCLVVFVIAAVIGLGIFLVPGPTPEEKANKDAEEAQRKASFSADYNTLSSVGAMAVVSGNAAKFEISGWHSSLDLYLPNRLDFKAAALANYFCNQNLKLKSSDWKVRVYFVDGTVGAECRLF